MGAYWTCKVRTVAHPVTASAERRSALPAQMATDVSRDGMGLELFEEGRTEKGRRAAFEVFYWDKTG
jgi:hypothetical protein